VTPRAFRKLALSLPEAHEAPHFYRTSFRVGKKIFATMVPDGSEAMVRVRPLKRIHDLLSDHPDAFFDYGGWTWRNGALGIHLRSADAKLLKELIVEAWQSVAPRRARTGRCPE
jgi:hypothetical protein